MVNQSGRVDHLGGGRYVIQGVLGEGAQGTTFAATRAEDGKPVAIKRFDVRGARSWKDVELAEREARVLATLDHPLVPRYIEHFEEDGALYLVMEKVEGETLDAIIRERGPLAESEVRRFLADADRALTYLHGRSSPIIHRDIKPRNVVRRPDGTYVIVDFGAVRELLRRGNASTIAGTIGYMAPEQLQGRALPSTDVYAVGATALTALTAAEPETLPHRGLRVDVASALAGRASPAMVSSIEQMLEPDPEQRPTGLAQVLDAVRSAPTPSAPPQARIAPIMISETRVENDMVRSLTKLLWVLWGIAWVPVPILLARLHQGPMIPVVMFGALAAIFIVTWHRGALLRSMFRSHLAQQQQQMGTQSTIRHRVDASEPRVRVEPLSRDEALARTEIDEASSERGSRRRRRRR
jgi:serine/threonine protein kinase